MKIISVLFAVVALGLLCVSCTPQDIDDMGIAKQTSVQSAATTLQELSAKAELFDSAEIYLFPDNTSKSVVLTADGGINTFSDWVEIKDNLNATLTSKFELKAGYLNDLYLYNYQPGESWIIEIAYSLTLEGDKTNIARLFFSTDSMEVSQIKSRYIPAGQKAYYRVMCNSESTEYISIGIRYFYE
jgi:hypothetical protein